MEHYPDPVRWSPTGDVEADAARLALIHAAALTDDAKRDAELDGRLAEVQGCPVATVPHLFKSDYERRQEAALASTAAAVPQADGDPGPDDGEGWDLLLDYDRDHHVPGMMLPHGAFDAHSFETGGELVRVVEIEDGPPDPHIALHILSARTERAGYTITGHEWSGSTNGWHMKLRLDPQPSSAVEAVALQAILGSDPLRESCNLQRAREVDAWGPHHGGEAPPGKAAAQFWRDRWNVLYRPNPNRKKVRP